MSTNICIVIAAELPTAGIYNILKVTNCVSSSTRRQAGLGFMWTNAIEDSGYLDATGPEQQFIASYR